MTADSPQLSGPPWTPRARRLALAAFKNVREEVDIGDPRFVARWREEYFKLIGESRSSNEGLSPTGAPAIPDVYSDPRYVAAFAALADSPKHRRIFGGKNVQPAHYLDCVAVGSDRRWMCTGTLIARRLVITAGHCLSDVTQILVGDNVYRGAPTFRVERCVLHPEYSARRRNDVLLLVLEEDVYAAEPRRIAPGRLIDASEEGLAVGFGNVDGAGEVGFGQKRQVLLPIVSPSCSGPKDPSEYECDAAREMVAGAPTLHDACTGDSGGPLYVRDRAKRLLLAGVTSRPVAHRIPRTRRTVCGNGTIFGRADLHVKWIESELGTSLP